MAFLCAGLSTLWETIACGCCAMNCCMHLTSCCTAGVKGEKMTRIIYVIYFLVGTTVALLMKLYGNSAVLNLHGFEIGCINGTTSFHISKLDSINCAGNQAAYRLGGGLFAFFIFCSFAACAGKAIHQGLWGVKSLIFVALIVGAFFISNNVFNVYAEMSRYVSIIFLILQIISIIDFVYYLHDILMTKAVDADDEIGGEPGMCSNKWKAIYVSSSFLMLIGSLVGTLYLYAVFPCSEAKWMISFTLFGIIIISALGFSPYSQGLLSGSAVCLYTCYLCWSSLSSYPSESCNPTLHSGHVANGTISFLIAIISMGYAAFSLADSATQITGHSAKNKPVEDHEVVLMEAADHTVHGETKVDMAGIEAPKKPTIRASTHKNEDESSVSGDEKVKDDVSVMSRLYFYLIMASSACYMSMVVTNWVSDAGVDPSNGAGGGSTATVWVKTTSQWVTFLVYLWTIVAPIVCQGRTFE